MKPHAASLLALALLGTLVSGTALEAAPRAPTQTAYHPVSRANNDPRAHLATHGPTAAAALETVGTAALEATLPAVTFSESELFKDIGGVYGANAPDYHGTAFWYGGHLGVVYSQGMKEGGVALFDIADPRNPKLVGRGYDPLQREGHTTGFIETEAGILMVSLASNGLNIWDLNDPTAPYVYLNVDLPGVYASDYDWGAWWTACQAPYIYVSGSFNGIFVVDLSDLASPRLVTQLPMSAGWRTGPIFAIGDLLVVSISDGAQSRLFDIGDPSSPVLLKEFDHLQRSYATWFNGGYLYGAMKVGGLEIIDLHDTDLPRSLSTTFAEGVGAYVMIQDSHAHVGNSEMYHMLDIADPLEPTVLGTGRIGGDNDFVSALGNLVALSDDHITGTSNVGTHFLPTATTPDRIPPVVNYVNPIDGQDWVPSTARVGITLSDQILVSSVRPDTLIVRKAGGAAVSGTLSIQVDRVSFFPDAPLEVETTYEVFAPAGGITDLSGNTLATEFRSTFLTGPRLINPPKADAGEASTGFVDEPVTLTAGRTTGGVGALEYAWDPGDGSPTTEFAAYTSIVHTYNRAGHYTAILTVRDSRGQTSKDTRPVTIVAHPLTTPPVWSATIAYDPLALRVWTVNPDADSIAAIDADALALEQEISVGLHPTTLSLGPDGSLWVVSQDSAELHRIDAQTLAIRARIALPGGSRPYGVVADPVEDVVYVSLEGTGKVLAIDGADGQVRWTASVGPTPRGLAIVEGSLFVSRFISPVTHGEVVELDSASGAPLQTWVLPEDPGPDSEISARGIPDYLSQLVPSPDGRTLFVPSVKQNTSRGLYRDGLAMSFETTNRAILSSLDLETGEEDMSRRLDFDNRDHASALALTEYGDYGFVALQGSQNVLVVDLLSGEEKASIDQVGFAPQGLVLGPDNLLFVQSFLGRNVAVYDAATLDLATSIVRVASIRTVTQEPLSQQELLGKRVFYNASDPRMSRDSYISCAGCHLDGGSDRRVWDFTDRGEGLRRTTTLRGRGGMLHGPVHWTANFDEIQDFENDIRNAFKGTGFMSDADFNTGTRSSTLGDPKTGISPELDALAVYVSSLSDSDASPYRNADGGLTDAAKRGRDLFRSSSVGCATCHTGPHFTDSVVTSSSSQFVLHDVGTLTAASGKRMGQTLTGLDTPTLKGAWNNAPYLHDGSAATLRDVLVTRNTAQKHGATAQLTSSQLSDLEAYVNAIDARSGAPIVAGMSPAPGRRLSKVDRLTVRFSAWPDPASVNSSSVQVLNGSTPVTGTLSVSRDEVRFVASSFLPVGTYTVKVSSSLRSVDGDTAQAWSGSFEVADLPLVMSAKAWSSRASSYALQSGLRIGSKVYGDKDDMVLIMPKKFRGLQYLKTAGNDVLEDRPALIELELSAPARVYVAFDRTQDPLPGWAADFEATTDRIIISNEDYTPHRIYTATFPAGKVYLGGPRASGGMFNKVNYFVIFAPP